MDSQNIVQISIFVFFLASAFRDKQLMSYKELSIINICNFRNLNSIFRHMTTYSINDSSSLAANIVGLVRSITAALDLIPARSDRASMELNPSNTV